MTSSKLLKLTGIGLTSLSLLLLQGCSTKKEIVREYVYVEKSIPAELLAECPGYTGQIVKNEDLVQAYREERLGREACNRDKQAIKDINANQVQ